MSSDFIGKTFGSYKLVAPLGKGGMATVYRGYQESIDRSVAIKLLPAELLHDPTFITCFVDEARALAILSHPAILPLYEYGEANGVPYIVMPIMAGGTFAERLASGPLPLPEVVRILTPIAEALNFAYQQGVLHRDVKPSNILFDHRDSPVLADFGLARLKTRDSITGRVSGTPAYMSPEQARGDILDGRSDLYSLGIVAYEALVGQRPFSAPKAIQLMLMQMNQRPPRPRDLRPEIPKAIEEIILKVIEKDPAGRYQTTTEFIQALSNAAYLSRGFWRPAARSTHLAETEQKPTPPPAKEAEPKDDQLPSTLKPDDRPRLADDSGSPNLSDLPPTVVHQPRPPDDKN